MNFLLKPWWALETENSWCKELPMVAKFYRFSSFSSNFDVQCRPFFFLIVSNHILTDLWLFHALSSPASPDPETWNRANNKISLLLQSRRSRFAMLRNISMKNIFRIRLFRGLPPKKFQTVVRRNCIKLCYLYNLHRRPEKKLWNVLKQ